MRLRRVLSLIIIVTFIMSLIMPAHESYAYKNMVEESDEDSDVELKQKYVIMYIGGTNKSLELFDYSEQKNNGLVNKKAKWSSSNEKVATVNKDGVVTALKAGYTHICADYEGKHYYCEITVYKPHLDYTEMILQKGDEHTIKLIGVETVSYKSSNKKIAKVNSSGKISALKNGKTTITVKGTDGKKYKCKVIVSANNSVESDNILTILYENGEEESFDITKEDVVIKENATSVIFGQYPQKQLIGKEVTKEIKNAKWDSYGNAMVAGKRYKRLSRMESTWYHIRQHMYRTAYDDEYRFIIEDSEFPSRDDDGYDASDNGYISYWSNKEFAYFVYEPIKWDILSIEDDGGGSKMLLVSHDVLDMVEYNTTDDEVTWEECTLRKWLNENFFANAFSKSEQMIIPKVKISTQDESFKSSRGEGGNDTKDRMFLLSLEDVTNEVYGFPQNPSEKNFLRRSTASEYASARGAIAWRYELFSGESVRTIDQKPSYSWLLRSPAWSGNDQCSIVQYNGECFYDWVDSGEVGLKPALYVTCKLGDGATVFKNTNTSQIGGNNILTVQYKNGSYESFDIKKDSIIISGDIKRIYFGRFCQGGSSKLDEFLTAEWDEDNNAIINKIKYKRVLYEDLYPSSRIILHQGNDFDLYSYFIYEPISWIPISVEESGGKKRVLLVSEDILGCYDDDNYNENITWGSSSIRDFLNGEFCSEAFTKKEISLISTVDIVDSTGKQTMDKVFMLSVEDVTNTKYGFSEDIYYADINRRASITDYVEAEYGDWLTDYRSGTRYGKIASEWRLRPDGGTISSVNGSGKGEENGYAWWFYYRPAIYIEIN